MAVAPLQSASAGELRAAIQDNQFALFRAMARLPGGVLEEGERNNFHYSPPLNPFFKGIWGTNLPVEAVNQEIDRTLSWFRAREAPLIFWWTGPSTAPADLGQRLEKRGFVSMESIVPGLEDPHLGTPGMVAELGKLNATALDSAPDGLEIELVQDEASLHEFKQVLVDGYAAPESMAFGWVEATLSFGFERSPWQIYLGRLDGEPVASNIIFNGGGVVGVYGVATVPKARRQGIGGAITLRPLLDARQAGYQYSVLFSTEMGIRVYERLGFQMTDVRISRYFWRNPDWSGSI